MRILLTVCGSISAYKSYDIVRSLINEAHQVRVILTRGALKFIKPQTFRYLGAENVYEHGDDFKFPKLPSDQNVLHIELARWCQSLVIAPASANTLANLSMGKASDLLTSVFLAIEPTKPILIFPALNTQMLNHTLVQENMGVIERLKKVQQVQIMPTKSGDLVCGESGEGKLEDVEKIVDLLSTTTQENKKQKYFLITTGATISPLDSVRYLTNPSSGKTGYLLAKAALARGHRVTMLAGIYACSQLDNFVNNPNYTLKRVRSTKEMQVQVNSFIEACDTYISAAAIGDIEFDFSESKIKKDDLGESLNIIKSPDILKNVVENHSDKFIIGFAAETNLTKEVLQKKWNNKPVNILIGTKVSNGSGEELLQGFGNQSADYVLYKDNTMEYQPSWNKNSLATYLVDQVEQYYAH